MRPKDDLCDICQQNSLMLQRVLKESDSDTKEAKLRIAVTKTSVMLKMRDTLRLIPTSFSPFLKQQGYLTTVANTNVERTNNDVQGSHNVQVRIPNREVQIEFSETMSTFYEKRYNFNPKKMEQCYNWLKNMDIRNAPECEESLRNVKTTLIDLVRDTCDTDINESWYEAFLFSIFMQQAEVLSQKKVRGTEEKQDM